ncbi:PREDICTED: uncharacterized protein At1g51745-like [Tarenaya hassleriana]|uniref:uncharacterized protein At1g51745-like n=1 Tax=Tarenaya hassleriana TaxID=28532 RepID=UPI00053C8880|nr:PREDICTED: uncharacterized protein At1g51745-like [Tarenaya hassleriana]
MCVMGSSDERNIKAIDASVGGLVWVRRRNGSWWPGRIMCLDEVPDGCLVSPKAGTPIKLLGRDDASVDWYNLEKSKRVKAFRCGEYDACIEKAKAAAAGSGKKAVKYARREDAIIHALEIENSHLLKDHPDLQMTKQNLPVEKTSSSREISKRFRSSKDNEKTTDVGDAKDEADSGPELLQSGVSFQEANNNLVSRERSLLEKRRRRRTPNDSEDDGTEGIKRMRGLEDLGMGIGCKGKGQATALVEHIRHENGLLCDVSLNDGTMPNGNLVNGERVCSPSLKRKRSQVVNANEHSRRKNRRRPLTKVLESTAMVSVPVTCDQFVSSDCSPLTGFSDGKLSGLEPIEPVKSVSTVINNNSDSTGVSCENAISLNASENVVETSHNKSKDSEISSISDLAVNESSDRLFDVPLIGEEKQSAGFPSAFTSCSPRRGLVSGSTRPCSQSSHDDVFKKEGRNVSVCMSPGAKRVSGSINGIEKSTSKWQIKGKRNSRQMSKKQEARRTADADETNDPLSRFFMSGQRGQPRLSANSCYMTRGDQTERNSGLYEVKIEVKANYNKPRNVPLVSLMSKLNGKAIVGHPLSVEPLEDGSCDHHHIVRAFDDVPMVDGGDDDDAHVNPKPSSSKKKKKKKTNMPPRKPSKSKKPSSSLLKKTRRLSALTGHKPRGRGKKEMEEKPKGQVVACIPLKLVFSRINEAVKSSTRQMHHHRPLPSTANP